MILVCKISITLSCSIVYYICMPDYIRWVYDCANYSHAIPRRWVRRHGFKTWSGIHSFLLNFNDFLKFTAILFESASVQPRVIQSSLRALTLLLRCGSEPRVALEYFEWMNVGTVGFMSTKLPKNVKSPERNVVFIKWEKKGRWRKESRHNSLFLICQNIIRLYLKLDKFTCSCKIMPPPPHNRHHPLWATALLV